MLPSAQVGHRVEIGGHVGTVRYRGEVEDQPGEWLGIEWDDVTRGKHSGEFKGKTYFTCSHPNAGSFVKYVPSKIEHGRSLVEAMVSLFKSPMDSSSSSSSSSSASSASEGLFLTSASQQSVIRIETVGFEKLQREQSHIELLETLQLKQAMISSAGSPGELQTLAPKITSLDVSRNLLHDWETVFSIGAQLKDLRILFLTGNRLMRLPDLSSLPANPFGNLQEIYLNEMGLDWSTVLRLEPCLPELRELHVRANDIRELPNGGSSFVRGFSKLRLLDLEYNSLEWSSVVQFAHLESLEVLMLNNNQISSIQPLDKTPKAFHSLTSLSLDHNQFPTWESLVALNDFPQLRELKFRENPVHKVEAIGVSRELLIGRFRGLQLLNASEISPAERIDSERYFLKWAFAHNQTEGVHAARVKELIQIHGEPVAPGPKSSNTLKEKLLALELVFPTLGKTLSKKVPANTQVRKFLALLQKLAKADLTDYNIYYIEPKTSLKVYFDDEFRDIEYFGVESGMTLFIDDAKKEETMNFSIAK